MRLAAIPHGCLDDARHALERVVLAEAGEGVQHLERARRRTPRERRRRRAVEHGCDHRLQHRDLGGIAAPRCQGVERGGGRPALAGKRRRQHAETLDRDERRRARRELAGLGLDLGVAVLCDERFEQADAGRCVPLADGEAAAQKAFRVLGVPALVERGSEEQVPRQLVVREGLEPCEHCVGIRIRLGQQQAREIEARREVFGIELQRALEPARRLLGQAEVRRDQRERAEREERAAADDAREARRRIPHLEAAHEEGGRPLEVAAILGCKRALEDQVGEIGEVAEHLLRELLAACQVTRHATHAAQARDQDRRIAELPPCVLVAQEREPLLVVAPCRLHVVHADVLGADVEVGEGRPWIGLELALQELEVALVLVALVDARLEVAVVPDPQRRRAEALAQVVGHRVADLLVDGTREAILRTIAPEPQREVLRGGPCLLLPGVVRLDEPVRLSPGLPGELGEPRGIAGLELLVGVEPEDPVAAGRLEAHVARFGEAAGPGEGNDARTEGLGDLDGAVGRTGVDDHHLGDGVSARREARLEHLLLVADDHAERDTARVRAGAGARGDTLEMCAQTPQRDRHGRAQGQPDRLAQPGTGGLQVAADILRAGVEPLHRLEQTDGERRLVESVHGDADVVQQHRLMGLTCEPRARQLEDRDRRRHPDVRAERPEVVQQMFAGALEQAIGRRLVAPAHERLAEAARVRQVVCERQLDELTELVEIRIASGRDERSERLGVASAVPQAQWADDCILALGPNDPECHVSVSMWGRGERARSLLVRLVGVPGVPGDE